MHAVTPFVSSPTVNLYKAVFDTAGDAICLHDGVKILDCNQGLCDLLAADKQAIVGRTLVDFSAEFQDGEVPVREKIDDILQRLRGELSLATIPWRVKNADGHIIAAEISIRMIPLPEGSCYVVIIRDIRNHTELEQRLTYQAAFQRLIAKIANRFMHGRRLDCVESFMRFDTDTAKGSQILVEALQEVVLFAGADRGFFMRFSKDYTDLEYVAGFDRAPQIGIQRKETDSISIETQLANWLDTLRKNKPVMFQSLRDIPDSQEWDAYRGILEAAQATSVIDVPVFEEQKLFGFIGLSSRTKQIAWDDSVVSALRLLGEIFLSQLERHELDKQISLHQMKLEQLIADRTRQLELAHAEIVRKERLSVLGQLLMTVSHEVRNPMAAIQASLFNLRDAVATSTWERIPKALEIAERNIGRVDRIIDELLDYSKERSAMFVETDMVAWLHAFLEDLPPDSSAICHVNMDYRGTAMIDRERMRRALVNVVQNAIHAALQQSGEEPAVWIRLGEEDAAHCKIEVSDNGNGISAAERDKIFQPLYSTKSFGVGLGLPIAKEVLNQHNGWVRIEDNQPTGARIVMVFPYGN